MDMTTSAMGGLDGARWKEQMTTGDVSKDEQLDEIAKEFEGIFIRQFLDKALTPMDPDSGMFGAKASPMYEHLIKDTLASSITAGKSLGFKSVLQAQLFTDNSMKEGSVSHD